MNLHMTTGSKVLCDQHVFFCWFFFVVLMNVLHISCVKKVNLTISAECSAVNQENRIYDEYQLCTNASVINMLQDFI